MYKRQHPGVNLKDRAELLDPILEAGVDGIEAFSSYHSQEQAAFYHKAACGRFRMITCGSDYHGKTKPSISIGGHGCTVPYEEMVRQLGRILGEMERKERSRGTRMKVPEMNDRRI